MNCTPVENNGINGKHGIAKFCTLTFNQTAAALMMASSNDSLSDCELVGLLEDDNDSFIVIDSPSEDSEVSSQTVSCV